jgi:CheY-like chemotaxis protein
VTAVDGVEALTQLQRGERFDLLFSDIAMPNGMPGDELAKHASQICRGIKVLLTSGYARTPPNGTIVRGIPVLRKPYRQDELAHAVRAALDRDAGSLQAGMAMRPDVGLATAVSGAGPHGTATLEQN